MAVYPDGHAYCYVCGKSLPSGNSIITAEDLEGAVEPYIEDLNATLSYIESLPKAIHRGVLLPYDDTFMYIVWPDGDYYKKRFRDTTRTRDKYRGPTGHTKPMFVAASRGPNLLIVEGELNALSIASLEDPESTIVCPGSATDFYTQKNEKYLPIYAEYASIKLIVDDDRAGTLAAIELKARLIPLNPNVSVLRMKKPRDANYILTTEGPEALRKEVYAQT